MHDRPAPIRAAGNVAPRRLPPRPYGVALRRVLDALDARAGIPFRVEFVDGTGYSSGTGTPAFTLRFRSRRAQWAPAKFGHVGVLESYFAGDLDVEGDLALAFRAALNAALDTTPNPLVALRNRWHERRFSNGSLDQAKANARFHYDLPEPFYRMWLDRVGMLYTCAYWREGTTTLEDAQRNKLDHVCRKVRLAPGETLVDVGCGFGGLLFHAHEHYGARPTGVNVATGQVAWLRGEVARRGLARDIAVVECDFREIPGQYDKLLSIGTLEHAGRDQLAEVIAGHARAMKPGALGVLHFIGHVGRFNTELYIRDHIFPGGWIPSLAEAIVAMERCGLEVLDVENLRRHYALTLDEWARRFDARWDDIAALDPARFTERFRRTWRTYLWSCAEMFRSANGYTHLFQVTVSKGNVGPAHPMSRAQLYAP